MSFLLLIFLNGSQTFDLWNRYVKRLWMHIDKGNSVRTATHYMLWWGDKPIQEYIEVLLSKRDKVSPFQQRTLIYQHAWFKEDVTPTPRGSSGCLYLKCVNPDPSPCFCPAGFMDLILNLLPLKMFACSHKHYFSGFSNFALLIREVQPEISCWG